MTNDNILYLKNNDRFIAYKEHKSKKKDSPTIIFLHGLMSDMDGNKAVFLHNYCQKQDYNFIRFDNYGHGKTSGDFTDENISSWLEGASAIIEYSKSDNIILAGSSKGGWLALLLALRRPEVIKKLLLIAPAPDFTEDSIWNNMTPEEQAVMIKQRVIETSGNNKDHKFRIAYQLIEDGRLHLLLDGMEININCPVQIIHGMQDIDVPYDISLKLLETISSARIVLKLIKDAGHRLSEPHSLQQIEHALTELIMIDYE